MPVQSLMYIAFLRCMTLYRVFLWPPWNCQQLPHDQVSLSKCIHDESGRRWLQRLGLSNRGRHIHVYLSSNDHTLESGTQGLPPLLLY